MNRHELLRFSFRLSSKRAFGMVMVSFALTAYLAHLATGAPRALRLYRVFTLSPDETTILFWVLTTASAAAAVFCLHFVVRIRMGLDYVELGPTHAVFPRAPLRAQRLVVSYGAVERVRVVDGPGQQMAIVSTPKGEACLPSTMFATPAEFTTFVKALVERAQVAQMASTETD